MQSTTNMPAPSPSTASVNPMPVTGRWFDGQSTRANAVTLDLTGDTLHLTGAEPPLPRHYAIPQLAVSEVMAPLPLAIGLPDGGTVWLDGGTGEFAARLIRATNRPQRVARLMGSWPAVLACVLCLLALLTWFDRQGAALAARAALTVVPQSVDDRLGRRAMQSYDRRWLERTKTPNDRQFALRDRFKSVAAELEPTRLLTLEFRREKDDDGFNAFALPNNEIVLLDGLVAKLDDDELMAVLGHELGHLVHRDGMNGVARSVGLVTVATVVLGDFSSVVATAVSAAQFLRYSREAESAADDYALQFLAKAGIPSSASASAFRKILEEQQRTGADSIPLWLSSHPDTAERVRRAEAANPSATGAR